MGIEQVIFHGGCHGCTQQQINNSYSVCKGCQYLEPNWSLPNLNNKPLSKADLIRIELLND